jgi:hypothetical protein
MLANDFRALGKTLRRFITVHAEFAVLHGSLPLPMPKSNLPPEMTSAMA